MYFNKTVIKNALPQTVLIIALIFLSIKVYSKESPALAKLTLKPTQCVSLHQGQQCFVTVDIHWQVNEPGKYCLYSYFKNSKLNCWANERSGHFKQELTIDKDVTFSLVSVGDDKVVASAVLELAWVHKKSRRSHSAWRIF